MAVPQLVTRRGKAFTLLLWALALLLPHAPKGWVAAPRPAPLPAGSHLRASRAKTGSRRSAESAATERAVLAYARGTTFTAGTNLRADAHGAAWTLLLPSLELGLVLCVGVPSAAALRGLSGVGRELAVVCEGPLDRRLLRRRAARARATGVRAVSPRKLPARHADLAVISGRRAARAAPLDRNVAAEVERARTVFIDAAAAWPRASALQLCPAAGEPCAVAAEPDTAMLAYLRRVAGADVHGGSRTAQLGVPGLAPGRLEVPAYVRAVARQRGLALDGHRAGLVAPAGYASRKALLFLFQGDRPEPELVVKIAREPRHAPRLENEWRALSALQDAGVPGALPRPAFIGRHAGVGVLGETAVAGISFRQRTSGRPDCALARAALDWLLELGAITAHPAAGNGEVADALADLASRFAALYRLTSGQRARLRCHVDAFGSAAAPLPLVLQHGDPGVWNLLVTHEGEPAFVDWEAAELDGIPLWDVFYFVRSFAVTVARARGVRGSMAAVRGELLRDGAVSRLLADAVERQRARLGIEPSLIEPLFVTCWMHRALKEATRLSPGRLDLGHYANLVRLSLDAPEAPGLRRLLSPSAGAAGARA